MNDIASWAEMLKCVASGEYPAVELLPRSRDR
jgi:hypothetical protein